MQNKKIKASIFGLSVVMCGAFLESAKATNHQVTDRVAISVPISCTMTSTINTEHSAEIENGVYKENVGTTSLNVFCNDKEGFSIYAVGFTGNEYGNTDLIDNQNHTIITGTATSGGTSNWAMKLITDSSDPYPLTINNGFDAYSLIPSTYTKVATRTSNTDVGIIGATIKTTYAAFINQIQPAGSYMGKVKYTLVHPSSEVPPTPQETAPGYIAYYPNTNVYEGSMAEQPLNSSDTSATLLASNFSRRGYGFAGWNTAYDYSGEFYGPNETISFEAGEYTDREKGLSLYAVWAESSGIIQDWQGCSSLRIGDTTALTDLRDNQSYAIAKLADDKCWTIENLKLENSSISNSDGAFSQGYNPSFVGLASPENDNFTDSNVANSIYSIDGSNSTQAIIGSNPGYRFPRYNNSNTSSRAISPSTNRVNIYSFGNYYTWAAAIADTSQYEEGNHDTTSICPTGWHLPTGGSLEADFNELDLAIGGNGLSQNTVEASNRWRKYPNNFVFSGYYDNSEVMDKGYAGSYWSSTTGSINGAYYLFLQTDYVHPGTKSFYKFIGQSIRCISD